MTARQLMALKNHPVFACATQAALLRAAVDRRDSHLLTALATSGWADGASFKHALLDALENPPPADMADKTALVLAIMANATIARGKWEDYGEALAGALKRDHLGAIAWAGQNDLPVVDCLPVRERMTTIYAVGATEAAFRLAYTLGHEPTAHQRLRVMALLRQAGTTPGAALFYPDTAFLTGCLSLPHPHYQ